MPRIIPATTHAGRFWLITLAALLALLATLSLGRWQLSRAAQKQSLHDAIEARSTLPPLTGTGWMRQQPAVLLHRPVIVQGRFEAEHTVFLDNRQLHGRPGFFVLTPLIVENGRAALLVQRGWVPRNFIQRDALPQIATPAGEVQLTGRIAPAPAKLFEFAHAERGRIRQNLDLVDYSEETGLELLPVSVLQTGPDQTDDRSGPQMPGGPPTSAPLLRDWPVPAAGVETHYGYAFQWFGLSALIVFLYVWHQLILPSRRRRHPA